MRKLQLLRPDSPLHICRRVGGFVERCFLVNEPAVATPQDEVEKTKNLPKNKARVTHPTWAAVVAIVQACLENNGLHKRLTTEALSRPMWGTAPGVHLLPWLLQISTKETIVVGLVAHFTSVKPLAHAEDDVSHMKAKAAVTTRSCEMKQQSLWNLSSLNVT